MPQKKDKDDWIYLLLMILFFLLKSFPYVFGVVPGKTKDTPKEPPDSPGGTPSTNPNVNPFVPPVNEPIGKPSPVATLPTVPLDDFISRLKNISLSPVPIPFGAPNTVKLFVPEQDYNPLDVVGALTRGWEKQSEPAKVVLGAAIAAPLAVGLAVAAPIAAITVGVGVAAATILPVVGATPTPTKVTTSPPVTKAATVTQIFPKTVSATPLTVANIIKPVNAPKWM